MRITLLQTDIKWSKPAENIAEAEALMAKAEDADLYVLPEMWSTGFVTDAPGEDQQEALQWMWTTAKRRHAAIAGSLAVMTEDGRSLNRQFFVKPDGDISTYDKHHLFKYGGEDRYYQTGRRRTVVEWRGVNSCSSPAMTCASPCGCVIRKTMMRLSVWPTGGIAPERVAHAFARTGY